VPFSFVARWPGADGENGHLGWRTGAEQKNARDKSRNRKNGRLADADFFTLALLEPCSSGPYRWIMVDAVREPLLLLWYAVNWSLTADAGFTLRWQYLVQKREAPPPTSPSFVFVICSGVILQTVETP